MDLDLGEVVLAVSEAKDGPDQNVNSKAEEEDSSTGEDSREGSLTKVPLQRGPRYLARPKIKIKTDVIIAIKGTLRSQFPERNKAQPPKSSEGKRFEDYTYAYGGAEDLSWLWPWPCPEPMKKLSPLCDNP